MNTLLHVGWIDSSTTRGITVSLGFFQDVEIPAANLRTPYTFDQAQETWVWLYYDEAGDGKSDETEERSNFFYEKGELVRFRVTAINFPDASWPKDGPCTSLEEGGAKIVAGTPWRVAAVAQIERRLRKPMSIVGAVDRDGLGLLSWWPQ
eukprot:s6698_g1.t1